LIKKTQQKRKEKSNFR